MSQSMLIISQEPHFAEVLAKCFEKYEFNTAHVETGNNGLKILLEQSFDVVIVDIELWDLHGLELISEALAHGIKNTLWYVISSKGILSEALKCKDLGVADYFYKGNINMGEILSSIRSKDTSALLKTLDHRCHGCLL